MEINIQSIEEFEVVSAKEEAVLFYFSNQECSVCKVLWPKVIELVRKNYPKLKLAHINIHDLHELAAQKRIFAVPTILVYFDGKEFIKKSRNFSIEELNAEISRIYQKMFG